MNFNYRKFYEQKIGIHLSSKFAVHHIDGDRENNNIKNLVALPTGLHIEYHNHLQEIKLLKLNFELELFSKFEKGSRHNTRLITTLWDFLQVQEKCNKWLDYRNHLLYDYPNIHNLSYF